MRKLSLAVEQSPDAVVISDLNANIEYVNQAFIDGTGYSRDEVLGKNSRMLQSGQTPQTTYELLWGIDQGSGMVRATDQPAQEWRDLL